MKWLKIMLGALFVICLVVAAWAYWNIFRGLPSAQELKGIEATRLSRVIASDGSVIAYYPPQGMIVLPKEAIPDLIKQAFVAAEDATFYTHAGLDLRRIFSALITDIRAASYVQGASTITQQVVRSYLLTRKKTIPRKIREIVLALRIEKALSKEEILNLYLGRIYLGSGAYGVGAASLRYFGKECRELNLAEASLIAGLAPAPARYSPLNDLPAAKRRQWYVLTRMTQEGFISETEAADAFQEPLRITGESVAKFTRYPYVTDYVRTQVAQRFGETIFDKGISIQTSISPQLQDAAIAAVGRGTIDLELRQGVYRGPERGLSETKKQQLLAFQANQLAWKGLEAYQLYWAEVRQSAPLKVYMGDTTRELGPEAYAWINPKGGYDPAVELKPGDLVRTCQTADGLVLAQEPGVQAALVAFNLDQSCVTALVGGVDYSRSQFNRAVSARRQSGSAIKPFIYAAAIDKGLTPATIIFDTPMTYQEEEDEEAWKPKNYEDRFYGPTSLRTGLVLSRNVVTIKILKKIGIGYTLNYLKRFGFGDDLPRDLSLALGSGSVSPYDLARAYAGFATYGRRFEPEIVQFINQENVGPIYTVRGNQVLEGRPQAAEERIISEQTAYITTNMLADVVQNGAGWRVRALKRPMAGKTGTSDDIRDAWFIGYSPAILCGVWVGYDNMLPLGENETGSRAASPIFVDFMQEAHRDLPVMDFPVPVGIVFARIDTQTGQLATPSSREVRFECFKDGTLPLSQERSSDELLLKEVY